MSPDGGSPEMPQGERWLELLGYSHLKGLPSGHEIDGEPVPVEEFDRLCEEHAKPIFAALERMGPDHPRYEKFLGVARKAFEGYFGSVEEAEASLAQGPEVGFEDGSS